MKLEFELRPSFGHARFYPMNQAARTIVQLTGRVCLLQTDLERLELAGFEIDLIDRSGLILKVSE